MIDRKFSYLVINEENNFVDGFLSYILSQEYFNNNSFFATKKCSISDEVLPFLLEKDVVSIFDNKINLVYRSDSEDNALVVTNQCNSNCIMCPDPDAIRNVNYNMDKKYLYH